ncbi:lactosylceramide 4-alpha-galactosyltransferase [Bufo bufo]|uniref:lactosylceramide 4-alpha-galactosyltransferase n=1 Tax=Bufo bufo TaxID=8384 RepID=UPI001ABE6482|nr:lactosylceramide 4-alpha-galactosyltransferase [Bufo bufo]
MKLSNYLSSTVTLNFKSWSMSLVSFSSLSLIFIFIYVKFTFITEEKAHLHHLPNEITCPDSIPNELNSSQINATSGGGIFFLETSDKTSPTFQVMCAVESAARANPNTKITIMMNGLTANNQSIPRNFGISLLSCFSNVEFVPLDFKKLFMDTPLSMWYSKVEKHWESVDYPTLSDACRLAILWKWGGIYLDTDFIILKNLVNITNSMGLQSLYTVNGAFLTFQPQHKFIELCMRDFVNTYNYWLYGHQGPQLLTRVYKRWCGIHRLRDKKSCRGVNILPKEAFYPVDWQDWKKYFEVIDPKEMKMLLRNSYGVHLWNKKSQGRHLENGSFLEHLQLKHCPTTNSLMKMYL